MKDTITIDIDYAKDIHKVLENMVSMGFGMVSLEATKDLTKEQRKRFTDIFYKYHNANCGPFNDYLKKLIDYALNSNSSSDKSESFNKNFTIPKAKPSPSKNCFHPCCPFRNEDDKCEIDVFGDEDNCPYRESNPSQNSNIKSNSEFCSQRLIK
jgi:hypothetical protein